MLVRNAMLTSLERERRQLSQDMLVSGPISSTPAGYRSDAAAASEREAQFFEDLLSELSVSKASMQLASRQKTRSRVTLLDLR